MTNIIGYNYEAALHCPDCARARFPTERRPVPDAEIISPLARDNEGNPVHPVFSTDEPGDGGDYCDDCGVNLRDSKDDNRPDKPENNNCLEGIACPKCGHTEDFLIEAIVTCYVTDEGAQAADHSHYYWDDDSCITCNSCDYQDSVDAFRVKEGEGDAKEN